MPQRNASCRVELSHWFILCGSRGHSSRIWVYNTHAQVISYGSKSCHMKMVMSRIRAVHLILQRRRGWGGANLTWVLLPVANASRLDMFRAWGPLGMSVCCSVLQCGAVCCSSLQCVAVCVAVCCRVLPYVAVWCSVVQCGAVWCSVLQCVAVCCSVLQCVAVCCSELSIQYECITPACVSSLRSFMNVCVCVMFVRVWCMICVWYVHDMFWACGPLGMPVFRWEWEKQASVTKFHSRKREWACACVRIHVFVRQSTRADARASIFAHVLEQQCLLSRHAFKQMFVRFKLTEARLHTWMYMRHPESGCV